MASKLDKLRKMNEQRSKTPVAERDTPVDALFDNKQAGTKNIEKTVDLDKAEVTPEDNSLFKNESAGLSIVNDDSSNNKTGTDAETNSDSKTNKEKISKSSSGDKRNTNKSLNSIDAKKPSLKKQKKISERYFGDPVDLSDSKIASWMCRIDESLYIRFQLLMAINSTTKSEMINRILTREQQWAFSHPEFPDINFKVEALKNKTRQSDVAYVNTSFPLTNENHAFVKEMSAKCLMKMYVYVSWVIEQYCDLADIPKEL